MFAKLENGSALCLSDYGNIKGGAIVPPVNELWAQVEECNTWGDLPYEYTTEYSTEKKLEDTCRAQRDQLLAEADILIFKAEDAGEDVTALRAYRQALRDVPEQDGFPWDVTWPEVSGTDDTEDVDVSEDSEDTASAEDTD